MAARRETTCTGYGCGEFAPDMCTAIQDHAAWLVNGIISDTREHRIRRCRGLLLGNPPSSSPFSLPAAISEQRRVRRSPAETIPFPFSPPVRSAETAVMNN